MRPLDVRLQKFLFDNGLTMPEFQLMYFLEFGGSPPLNLIEQALAWVADGYFDPAQTSSDNFSRNDYEVALELLVEKGIVCLLDEQYLEQINFLVQLHSGPAPCYDLPELGDMVLTLFGIEIWIAIDVQVFERKNFCYGWIDESFDGCCRNVMIETDKDALVDHLDSEYVTDYEIIEIRPWRESWWLIHDVIYKAEYYHDNSPERERKIQAKRKRRENDKN